MVEISVMLPVYNSQNYLKNVWIVFKTNWKMNFTLSKHLNLFIIWDFGF